MKTVKRCMIIAAVCLFFTIGGCGTTAEEVIHTYQGEETSKADSTSESASSGNNSEKTAADTASKASTDTKADSAVSSGSVFVYVCGAVNIPGVYELPSGARIIDAIAKAGGLTEDADLKKINQASLLTDGEQITVLTHDESAVMSPDKETVSGSSATDSGTLVNINTADEKTLMTLSGIGETKAAAIIDYRDTNGAFRTIEEITKVPGIGDGLYSRIKTMITAG